MRIKWASCVLVLALAALPAFAEDEGEAGTEALAAESGAGEEAPEASLEPLSGRVARAGFTTQVVDREPQDSITSLSNDASRILFFSEFRGLEGQTLSHVWERDGTEMARVAIVVGGSRWRAYSAKNLDPSWLGEWKVNVVDEEGRVLRSESFEYIAADAQPDVDEAVAEAQADVDEAVAEAQADAEEAVAEALADAEEAVAEAQADAEEADTEEEAAEAQADAIEAVAEARADAIEAVAEAKADAIEAVAEAQADVVEAAGEAQADVDEAVAEAQADAEEAAAPSEEAVEEPDAPAAVE